MKKHKSFLLFSLGGGLYTLLELLWRGRSHWSMFLLGGGCFLALGRLGRGRLPLPAQPLADSAVITAGELCTGLLLNRSYHIWDYRQAPWNFQGQICLQFSLLWVPVSLAGITLYRWLEKKL